MHFVGLAFLSSISPQTLAVVLFLLGGTRGLRHAWLFITGTLFTSVAAGVVVAVGLGDLGIHVSGLGGARRFTAAYITGGVLFIVFAGYVVWRNARTQSRPHTRDRAREERRLDRMVESSWVAFAVGLVFGLPGPGYALALAETSGHSLGFTVVTVLVFSVISYSWAWIPTVWFMLDAQRATRLLTAFRASVSRHHIAIIATVLALVGIYLLTIGIATA
jgi:hypothetical protein